MARYSVAHAKDHLSKLIDEARAGEEVTITRHGEPVAYLRSPAERPIRQPSQELVAAIVERAKKRPIWARTRSICSRNAGRRVGLIYLDASVLLSLIIADAHTASASAWYSSLSAAVVVSDFASLEVSAVASRHLRVGRLT